MSAIISKCGRYRYRLDRSGYGLGNTAIIMVNPSTADAETDDATIRKLKGFGHKNAWGDLVVGNLFAFRATDVRDLATERDPIGPTNDSHLLRILRNSEQVIVAWGALGKLPKHLQTRWQQVVKLIESTGHVPKCIGAPLGDGHPRHPLMAGYALPIQRWHPPK